MNRISVILPVHEITEGTKPLFDLAIKSLQSQKVLPDAVIIVTPENSDSVGILETYDFGNIKPIVKILKNPGLTDYCSQINYGIDNCETEYVSLFELDDEYSNIWFKNVKEYIPHYPQVDVFMPIVADVNKDGQFIGTTNEAVWAHMFADDQGFLDNGALLSYQNFNISGSVIKKTAFEEYGKLKPSIKLTFGYEFLLRLTHNDSKVFTIPRFGYKHSNLRDGSLFDSYTKTIDQDESQFWLKTAKKEYYWPQDRNIIYQGK